MVQLEGDNMMASRAGLFATIAVTTVQSQASYILTPLSGGQSSISVSAGDSFTLDINLESTDGLDEHNSAIFQLVFTSPGIELLSYSWASPYETGTVFDDSTPNSDVLPMTIDENSLMGPGYPDGVIDIEFSNVLISDLYETGEIVSLELRMSDAWDGTAVTIFATPDTFANGFHEIETTAGQGFTIVPAPATFSGLFIAILAVSQRRR